MSWRKVFGERFVFDFFNDFFEEAKDHELHGGSARDTALHHVEEFVGIEVTGGGTVGTAHVVGEDFKCRGGHWLRRWDRGGGSVGLVGVGLLCAFRDFDQAGEDGAALVEEGVFVEEIGDGVVGVVGLEGALIKFLIFLGDGEGIHFDVCAGAFNPGLVFVAGVFRADINGEVFHLGRSIGDGGVELEGGGLFIPVLHDLAEDRGAGGSVQVGHCDVEGFIVFALGEEDIHDGGFGLVFGDYEGCGKTAVLCALVQ